MIKKILAPINRWDFTFYVFLFLIFIGLYVKFGMFFDLHGVSPFYAMCLEFLIILFLIFKRFVDIFNKLWKSIIISIICTVLLVAFLFLSLSTVTYNTSGIATCNNPILAFVYSIYSTILVLFLCLKNNTSTKFFHLEWKLAIKRIILLVLIFIFYKFLCLSYDTVLTKIDYRMYPTLEIQDQLLVSKITKKTSLERGDIVSIKENGSLPKALRIIGLPNEEIKLKGRKVYINEQLFNDKFAFYSSSLKPIDFQETIKLDSDSYFLMGDNRYYDKRSKILIKDKKNNKTWKTITFYPNTERNSNVYLTLRKDELLGKVIAVHYDNFKFNNKYSDIKVLRSNISYIFATKNKKFGFNPSSQFENIFGKP